MRYLLKEILKSDGNVVENTKNAIDSLANEETEKQKRITFQKVSKKDPVVVNFLKTLNKYK